MTNETSYALLDAYYDMNVPQPILSVKLHRNTPAELYEAMGRFFFTPGCLTPSLFNDDALFEVLRRAGVEEADLPDYAVAGCQEPLIMGKDNGNTTNSWLNMPKILELTLNGGVSTVTGERIGTAVNGDFADILTHLRERFYENAAFFVGKMTAAANGASQAVSCLPVPFLSVFMGGLETGIDTRDTEEQGTKYNGSGCLIHGLSVMADSFIAVDHLLKERPEDVERLHRALQNNFEGDEELRQYLLSCPKFGNNIPEVDEEARQIAEKISDLVASQKNYLGNPFRPDWTAPPPICYTATGWGRPRTGARRGICWATASIRSTARPGRGLGSGCCRACASPMRNLRAGMPPISASIPNTSRPKAMRSGGCSSPSGLSSPSSSTNKTKPPFPPSIFTSTSPPPTLCARCWPSRKSTRPAASISCESTAPS